MMMGKEDLGLSLSLGYSQNHKPNQLNLNPNSSLSINNLQRFPWNQTFVSTTGMMKNLRSLQFLSEKHNRSQLTLKIRSWSVFVSLFFCRSSQNRREQSSIYGGLWGRNRGFVTKQYDLEHYKREEKWKRWNLRHRRWFRRWSRRVNSGSRVLTRNLRRRRRRRRNVEEEAQII